jgi:hypothetical protein
MIKHAPKAAPTPVPAFAPVVRPLCAVAVTVGRLEALVDCEALRREDWPEVEIEELWIESVDEDDAWPAVVLGVVGDADIEAFGGDEVLDLGAEVLEVSGDVFDPVMWKAKLYEKTEVSLSREITKP